MKNNVAMAIKDTWGKKVLFSLMQHTRELKQTNKQKKTQVPAADMVTQFRQAEASMERPQEGGLLSLSSIQ